MVDGRTLALASVAALAAAGLVRRRGSRALAIEGPWEGREGENRHVTQRATGTLPVAQLLALKGARGEHRLFAQRRSGAKTPAAWQAFVQDVRQRGVVQPVFVVVEWTHNLHPNQARALAGEPLAPVEAFVYEGNHRIRAAVEAGLSEVPVEIKWVGQSERHVPITRRASIRGSRSEEWDSYVDQVLIPALWDRDVDGWTVAGGGPDGSVALTRPDSPYWVYATPGWEGDHRRLPIQVTHEEEGEHWFAEIPLVRRSIRSRQTARSHPWTGDLEADVKRWEETVRPIVRKLAAGAHPTDLGLR